MHKKLLDRIGVDPYDVDLDMLRFHAWMNAKERESRFWFRSPCYALMWLDFVVHVLLPAMMRERHPRIAQMLKNTSPRWSHVRVCDIPARTSCGC